MPNESSMSMSSEQNRRPASVSTSWVTIAQLAWPSGQNQINGTFSEFFSLIDCSEALFKNVFHGEIDGPFGKSTVTPAPERDALKILPGTYR